MPHVAQAVAQQSSFCLEGFLNCICARVCIKVNVFIQKNTYHIHNYVHTYIENCLFREKYSCSS